MFFPHPDCRGLVLVLILLSESSINPSIVQPSHDVSSHLFVFGHQAVRGHFQLVVLLADALCCSRWCSNWWHIMMPCVVQDNAQNWWQFITKVALSVRNSDLLIPEEPSSVSQSPGHRPLWRWSPESVFQLLTLNFCVNGTQKQSLWVNELLMCCSFPPQCFGNRLFFWSPASDDCFQFGGYEPARLVNFFCHFPNIDTIILSTTILLPCRCNQPVDCWGVEDSASLQFLKVANCPGYLAFQDTGSSPTLPDLMDNVFEVPMTNSVLAYWIDKQFHLHGIRYEVT